MKLSLKSGLVLSCMLASTSAIAWEPPVYPPSAYVFGGSQPDGFGGQTLEIQLAGGGTYIASTAVNPIGSEANAENFGWWSTNFGHFSNNYNYFAGYNGVLDGWYRNFFAFDLSGMQGTAVSATLHLDPHTGPDPYVPVRYDLFDVSTPAPDLLAAGGPNAAIFDDLGSGKQYGSYLFDLNPSTLSEVSIALSTAAIDDINARQGAYFSVGGSVAPVPVPASALLFGSALTALAARRTRRK